MLWNMRISSKVLIRPAARQCIETVLIEFQINDILFSLRDLLNGHDHLPAIPRAPLLDQELLDTPARGLYP